MKCKDCKYFHIKEPTGYSRAFCGHWLSDVGEIKRVIRKCEYYVKKGGAECDDCACEIANERDKAIKDLVEEDWRNRNEHI